MVSPYEAGGGAEFQIQCLLRVLAERDRHDLHFLAHHPDPVDPSRAYRLVRVGQGSAQPRLGYVADARSLLRSLGEIRPVAVYQRVAGGYTGLCAWYARRAGARLVWHVASENDVNRANAFGDRNPLRRWLNQRSVEYGARHAHCVVAQTAAQSSLMQQHYGRAADAIVPNFHPLPEEELDKSGPLRVVWVSNLKPMKRPEVFVRLAQALRGLADVRFVMIGADAGAASWSAALKASMAAPSNIEFLGQISQSEVNAILARSHVFVNTSTVEGFPNTFIQAWMRAVPVVSLDVDPDGVLVRQQIGFRSGTEAQLAADVRRLLTDPLLRQYYGERARTHALAVHSLANATVLADLLEGKHGHAALGQ